MPGAESVAFLAGMFVTGFTFILIEEGEIVVFNHIRLNLNNAFNSTTGKFVAPVWGIYEFNIHVEGNYKTNVDLKLYKMTGT